MVCGHAIEQPCTFAPIAGSQGNCGYSWSLAPRQLPHLLQASLRYTRLCAWATPSRSKFCWTSVHRQMGVRHFGASPRYISLHKVYALRECRRAATPTHTPCFHTAQTQTTIFRMLLRAGAEFQRDVFGRSPDTVFAKLLRNTWTRKANAKIQ
jgi:hypothetical protein